MSDASQYVAMLFQAFGWAIGIGVFTSIIRSRPKR